MKCANLLIDIEKIEQFIGNFGILPCSSSEFAIIVHEVLLL